jgi:hypothetical protein
MEATSPVAARKDEVVRCRRLLLDSAIELSAWRGSYSSHCGGVRKEGRKREDFRQSTPINLLG